MEFGIFLIGRNIRVGLEKEGSSVQPICPAMDVRAAMQGVGTGCGTHIDMRAAGGTLLSVVHAGVDAQYVNGFGCGCWQRLTDGEIRRGGALYHGCTGTGGAADPGIIYYTRGSYLAGAF